MKQISDMTEDQFAVESQLKKDAETETDGDGSEEGEIEDEDHDGED